MLQFLYNTIMPSWIRWFSCFKLCGNKTTKIKQLHYNLSYKNLQLAFTKFQIAACLINLCLCIKLCRCGMWRRWRWSRDV